MRTIGEILKKVRLEKNLTYEAIEKQLRIRKKYLIALEDNDWINLPSLTYIKGFLRNYSEFLGLKEDEMVAIFRRQYHDRDKTGILPEGVTTPLNDPVFRLTPRSSVVLITVSCVFIFFAYLTIQYYTFISPPSLAVDSPQEGEIIIGEIVEITGKSDPDAVVEINDQKIALSDRGEFSIKLTLVPGINTVNITSISKFGKKRTLSRTIQLSSK